tara:strand:+ start:9862 stop:10692 length:831 start_codon:yes stop_codon:yes gene_type:complete
MTFRIKSTTYNSDDFPLIVGILNLTPDSFYDGGKYTENDKILRRVEKMIKEGADIIDVGAESTRPQSKRISTQEELERLLEPLKIITSNFDIPISIDTMKSEVADAALSEGAEIINDATGFLFDKEVPKIVGKHNASIIINHTPALPEEMQSKCEYVNIINDIKTNFEMKIISCIKEGISKESIVIDPGIGFGKTLAHNIELIIKAKEFKIFNLPLMYGVSNKNFIGQILKIKEPSERVLGSVIAANACIRNGADLIRVHNIKETKEMILMWRELG